MTMNRLAGCWTVAPAVIVLAVLFFVPVMYGFWLSFHTALYGVIQPGLTLKQYEALFANTTYLEALWRTLRLSLAATALTLLVGYPLAYILSFRARRTAGLLTAVILAPLLMNVVVRTLGWMVILGRNGLINEFVVNVLGLPELRIMYTETAILIGYVQVFLPFMVLSVLSSMQNVDIALIKAAISLGATPARAFRQILLPLTLPGILSGCVIVFGLSTGSFVLPAMLGGTRLRVLALLAYQQTTTTLNYPLGAAAAFLLLFIVLSVVVLATRTVERSRYREVFQRANL